MGIGAWHFMYSNGSSAVETSPVPPTNDQTRHQNDDSGIETIDENSNREISAKNNQTPKANLYANSLINENIIIIETSPKVDNNNSYGEKQNRSGRCSSNSGRASATIRSLSDAELPDPETVRKVKSTFEALAKKHQDNNDNKFLEQRKNGHRPGDTGKQINRSQSMIVFRGRAWCNGGSGTVYHRHAPCDSAIHTCATTDRNGVTSTLNPQRPSYQRSCSELDQYFREDNQNVEEKWDNQDRGSPVSPEVIAKIRQHGTCVKFFGAEAEAVSDVSEWEYANGHDDSLGDGYLLDYSFIQHKPKIIGAIPKSNSTGSGSSCASSTSNFDDYENCCSSGPTSPYSWLNLGGTLERLRAVFGGDDNDNFRLNRSNSMPECNGYMKVIKPPRHDDYEPLHQQNSTRYHGIWRKNPCWPGSYYVIYDFTQPKEPEELHEF